MNFQNLNTYVHQYDFTFYNTLIKNKSYFEDYYDNKIKNTPKEEANVSLIPSKKNPYKLINNAFLDIVSHYYYVSPPVRDSGIGIYKQTDVDYASVMHNHVNSSTLVGILYIDPPKPEEGGEIEFNLPIFNYTYTLQPQPGKIYIFPSWLYHRPLPQKRETSRISLNWGYWSDLRPVHKITKTQW